MSSQLASIDTTEEDNEYGHPIPCVYATCEETGESVGPIWGDGHDSVSRALATLTDECSCGASWHMEA